MLRGHGRALASLALLFLAFAIDASAQTSSSEGRRRLLLIGASEYDSQQFATLPNVPNDTAALEQVLRRLGFNDVTRVGKGERVNRAELFSGLSAWLRAGRPDDFAVIYIAGHGFQDGNAPYFAPSDFGVPQDLAVLDEVAVPVSRMMQMIDGSVSGRALVIFDFCRTPLVRGAADALLVSPRSSKPDQVAIMFSASPLQPASDGKAGELGALMAALAPELAKEAPLNDLLRAAGAAMKDAIGQTLDLQTSLASNFYLTARTTASACEGLEAALRRGDEEMRRWLADHVLCEDQLNRPLDDGTGQISIMPPRLYWTRDARGEIMVQYRTMLSLRNQAGWKTASKVAREWWDDYERRTVDASAPVSRVLEEAVQRKATIDDLMVAQANATDRGARGLIDSLDRLLTERARAAGAPPPTIAALTPIPERDTTGTPDPAVVAAFSLPAAARGAVLLGGVVPWGVKGPAAAQEWARLTAGLTANEIEWLLFQAREIELTVSDLIDGAGGRPINRPLSDFVVAVWEQTSERAISCSQLENTIHDGAPYPPAALPEAEALVAANPQHDCAQFVLGVLLWSSSQTAAGVAALERAKSLGYQSSHMEAILGVEKMRSGDNWAALAHFTEILKSQPEDGAWHTNVAELYLHEDMLKETEQALDDAGRAYKLTHEIVVTDPESLKEEIDLANRDLEVAKRRVNVMRSAVRIAQDRPQEAAELLSADAALPRGMYEGHEFRCWVQAYVGDAAQALTDCDRAAAVEYNRGEATLYRAHALFRLRRYREAEAAVNDAMQRMPSAGMCYFERALILWAQDRKADADLDFERARLLGTRLAHSRWLAAAFEQLPGFLDYQVR